MSKQSEWRPIETLDRDEMQFVLVTEDGAVRLNLWNPRGYFELPSPIGVRANGVNDCGNPTHWMPCPEPPDRLSELSKGEVKG